MKKRRKKSLKTKNKSKLWLLVKEYVFKRDKNRCQWCLKEVEGSNRHPSHVLGKKAYPRLEFDPLNVKTLCFNCHLQKWHLCPTEATKWFISKFPERMEYLEHLKLNQAPTTEQEIEDWIKEMEELNGYKK